MTPLRPLLSLAVLVLALLAFAPSAQARPLVTAVTTTAPFFGPGGEGDLAYARLRAAGARAVRIYVSWRAVAGGFGTPGSGFDSTNPGDPNYQWGGVDRQVRLARAFGLEPILSISDAPEFAEGSASGPAGTRAPDPVALGGFARAVARRYTGSYAGLPRARYFQVWNEPNASYFLNPQLDGDKLASVERYRAMVNQVADSVYAVSADNRVVAGGTFPFYQRTASATAIGAKRFLQALVAQPVQFDVWSTHPYTQGNAFHQAFNDESVSMGDLPELKAALDAARRSGRIRSRGSLQFWITEMSWDSNPPDPKGVPTKLLTRWTAEALHQAWRSGVTLFTWFAIQDEPLSSSQYQSGLYYQCSQGFACARPKPALTAFRFPFVAYRRGERVTVWGRTAPPDSLRTVVVEQQVGGRYARLGKVKADSGGIFRATLRLAGRGAVRARTSSDKSAAFSLKVPRDLPLGNPFGS